MAEMKATGKTAVKTAIRSKRKKSSSTKLQPAVRYLRYNLVNSATPGTETSHYIDLARDLSAVNRRLYRQGRDYHVKRISIVSSNTLGAPGGTAGRITVGTVPNSWVVRNAWRRGFMMWNKMNDLVLKNMSDNLKPKFHDFKIRGIGSYAPTPTYETPLDNGGNAVALGEWSYSFMVTPDGTTSADDFTLHLLGDHIGAAGARSSVGLVKSYAETRATVDNNEPNTAPFDPDDPLLNLFDAGTQIDEIASNLQTVGEDQPYSNTVYPGETGNMPQPLVVQQTTLGADGRASVGGFNAICGLLEVEITSPVQNDVYSVLVELAPGKYRGIDADVI